MPSSRYRPRPLYEQEEYLVRPKIGDGISRPSPKAKKALYLYKVVVADPTAPKMSVMLKAETKTKAKMYAQNRWPNSKIEEVTRINWEEVSHAFV